MLNPETILITGASSGLGAAMAELYAEQGTHLFLHGRNAERLAAIADKVRGRGATCDVHCGDVSDAPAMEAWINACDEQKPLDLVIVNAGISAGTGGRGETAAQTKAIFSINVSGVLNTAHPAAQVMKARRRGQIAMISSLAGFRGFPGAPAYCASKAAVRIYGEGLRGELARHGVEVCVVCPGFVKTPMTDVNRFSMPFLMDAQKAARIIQQGLSRNRPRIAFPWPMYLGILLLSLLPQRLLDRALRLTPRKI